MKRAIQLPRPALGFPDAGWRDRLEAAVAEAERGGLALACELAPPADRRALEALEVSLGPLPRGLRALLEGADGGRLGHLALHGARKIQELTPAMRARWSGVDGRASLEGVPSSALFAFAQDLEGSTWAVREAPPGAAHAVVYLSEFGLPVEHRFATVGTFLESALARAHAAALHRQAESREGDDLDDGPWLEAARRAEAEIDPRMLRTRDD